jgi:cyclin-dependent kinase 7
MAVSPVVAHPTDAIQHPNPRAVSSPLKNASSAQASSNGTPQAPNVAPNATAAVHSAALDLSEQMNEDEKRKYAKGWPIHSTDDRHDQR